MELAFELVELLVGHLLQPDEVGTRVAETSDQLVELELDRARVTVLAVLEQEHDEKALTGVTVAGIRSQFPEKCQIGPVSSHTAVAPKAIKSASGEPTMSGARRAAAPEIRCSGLFFLLLPTGDASNGPRLVATRRFRRSRWVTIKW